MSTRFDILDMPFQGLKLLQRKPIGDDRGYLERMYCSDELNELMLDKKIIQINHTVTVNAGTVRGMHFQYPPHAETKFVSCLRGEVFDVVIDIRQDSPTFLFWHAEILSASNYKTLVIPEGFAHGFQTLTIDCEMLYLHTAAYHAAAEAGFNATDQKLNIQWPLPTIERSVRDASHPFISDDFKGVIV